MILKALPQNPTLILGEIMQDILLLLQHHTTLSTALIIALILLTILEFIKSKNSAHRLTPAAATQMINHKNATILDVRAKDIFNAGHIVDAISIPLAELDSKYKKLEKAKNHPIIIVCATSVESTRAAAILTKHGYTTHILAGGMRSWKDADMPIVKG